jgi:hypothetical protein
MPFNSQLNVVQSEDVEHLAERPSTQRGEVGAARDVVQLQFDGGHLQHVLGVALPSSCDRRLAVRRPSPVFRWAVADPDRVVRTPVLKVFKVGHGQDAEKGIQEP